MRVRFHAVHRKCAGSLVHSVDAVTVRVAPMCCAVTLVIVAGIGAGFAPRRRLPRPVTLRPRKPRKKSRRPLPPSRIQMPPNQFRRPDHAFPALRYEPLLDFRPGELILQWHPAFPSKYSGKNSLRPRPRTTRPRSTRSISATSSRTRPKFFSTWKAPAATASARRSASPDSPNLDVVRNPDARRNALSRAAHAAPDHSAHDERVEADRDEFHLATSLPARRIEFRIGKFGMADFFDLNTYGSDSHLQFLNWTVDNNGAYDYAANTRGYTDGAILEYDDHWFTARFAEALMPKVANGIHLDADIARARAENLELEARGKLIAHREGTVRLLGYLNHANMGNYREAINDYLASTKTPPPDIIATRRQGRHKYGFGLNFEQAITARCGRLRASRLERRPQRIIRLHGSRPHARAGRLHEGHPRGTAATIAPASCSLPTESSPRINNIWRSADSVSCSATAA